jgi:hypothetical protein
VLRAASELQERSRGGVGGGGLTGSGDGITLEDLREVAAEVGIDARFVQLAADRVRHAPRSEGHWFAGAPFAWKVRRTVPGVVRAEDRDRIIQTIRDEMDARGSVEDVYGRMEWTHDDGAGPVVVGLASREGMTEVDVSARRGSEVGLLQTMGILTGTFVVGLPVGAALLGLGGAGLAATMAGAAGASYLAGRSMWKWAAARWEERVERLVESVAATASEVAVPEESSAD